MNIVNYISQKINLDKIKSLNKVDYQIALFRWIVIELSKIVYRNDDFFLDKENLFLRDKIYQKFINELDAQDLSVTCKSFCCLVEKICKRYGLNVLLRMGKSRFSHSSIFLKVGNKYYFCNALHDIVNIQTNCKTEYFFKKQTPDRLEYKTSYKTEKYLKRIDGIIGYAVNGYFDEWLKANKVCDKMQLFIDSIKSYQTKSITDCMIFAKKLIKLIWGKKKGNKFEVSFLYTKKSPKYKSVLVKNNNLFYIFYLNGDLLIFNQQNFQDFLNKNKLLVFKKIKYILYKYLLDKKVSRNFLNNSVFLNDLKKFESPYRNALQLRKFAEKFKAINENSVIFYGDEEIKYEFVNNDLFVTNISKCEKNKYVYNNIYCFKKYAFNLFGKLNLK